MSDPNIALTREKHPNWYHDIPVMTSLILGSFPPHEKKRDYPFYYPNKQNNFWKILAALAGMSLQHWSGEEAVKERKVLMEKLRVGVENMGKVIQRKGTSAKDTDIQITEFHPILSILDKHPELSSILLAGYSAKHSTFQSFCRYLRLNSIDFTPPAKTKPGESFSFSYKGRRVDCILLHSTSTATRIALKTLIEEFSAFISVPDPR